MLKSKLLKSACCKTINTIWSSIFSLSYFKCSKYLFGRFINAVRETRIVRAAPSPPHTFPDSVPKKHVIFLCRVASGDTINTGAERTAPQLRERGDAHLLCGSHILPRRTSAFFNWTLQSLMNAWEYIISYKDLNIEQSVKIWGAVRVIYCMPLSVDIHHTKIDSEHKHCN